MNRLPILAVLFPKVIFPPELIVTLPVTVNMLGIMPSIGASVKIPPLFTPSVDMFIANSLLIVNL